MLSRSAVALSLGGRADQREDANLDREINASRLLDGGRGRTTNRFNRFAPGQRKLGREQGRSPTPKSVSKQSIKKACRILPRTGVQNLRWRNNGGVPGELPTCALDIWTCHPVRPSVDPNEPTSELLSIRGRVYGPFLPLSGASGAGFNGAQIYAGRHLRTQ